MPIDKSPSLDEDPAPEKGDGSEFEEMASALGPKPEPIETRRVPRQEPRITAIQTTFSGPLPPPDMLKAYNEIESGLAREIIELAKGEASHRQITERDESKAAVQIAIKEADAVTEEMRRGYTEGFIGQCFAFVFGVFTIGCATILGMHHAETTASILGGGGLVAIISAFLKRSVSSASTNPESKPQAKEEEKSSE